MAADRTARGKSPVLKILAGGGGIPEVHKRDGAQREDRYFSQHRSEKLGPEKENRSSKRWACGR